MKHKLGKQILAALTAGVIGLCMCLLLFSSLENHEEEIYRKEVTYLAKNTMGRFVQTLEGYENIPQVWSGVVKAENGEIRDFEEISQQLYEKNPTINAIQLAPAGIVSYTYPKNIDIIGHDLFNDDARKEEAAEARDTGEFVISGPFDLIQGGEGVIIRYPIELNEEFWGFSTIVLNYPDLFEDLEIDRLEEEGYAYRLEKEAEEENEFVFGSDEEPEDPVVYTVDIGRRTWKLSISPVDGWINAVDVRTHRAAAAFISLLCAVGAFLVTMVLTRNKELEEMKSDLTIQTKALAASEKANRMQAKALEVSKKANEMQAEALEASKKANQAQIQALEMARKENIKQAEKLEASEAANRAKTEFISRISHDIRTPIGAIQNLTDFALQDIETPERLRQDLEKIQSSNQFLLSLINDVLDISRVDSGKIELSPEPYPFEEYTVNIRNIMEPMCSDKGLTFTMEDGTNGKNKGVMVADKIRINQIALNILSNAVKYTPKGGSVHYISHSEAMDNGNCLFAFTVRDTGIGMSKEFQKRMFEEFSQEYDNPHREKGTTGTGLGLSIVKRMVELMNGTIEVESDTGKGTAVSVRIVFPDALQDPSYLEEMEKKQEETKEKLRFKGHILVAEDNLINQEIALRIFEECGLSADLAQDGQEAVEMFTSHPKGTYDAIFMDIQMPKMNGYEATKAIRSLAGEEASRIPIVAMTADAFDEAVHKAEEAGMDEYITKPLNVEYLMQIMMKIGLGE